MVLNFFVLKIQKVCFFKKDHLADLMARWVCRLHNLYFARRSALFVRLALLYKEAFFRIDARSDLDSQGRFSRGEVILVGINLSRHWLINNRTAGTVFWKGGPAAPNLLPDRFRISLLSTDALGGVWYDGRAGQYPVRSQQHSDPRFQLHYEKILSNRVYFWSGGPKYFLL